MIKLIKSTFYREKETKEKLVRFIKDADMLSFGKECAKFETNFAKWQGRGNAVFLNSGSSANMALIQALLNLGRLKKGDPVGFSAVTWSTNTMPLIQLGLNPVPVDIELDTLNTSSKNLLEVLEHTGLKALFITNLLGFCSDIDTIKKICREKKIILIEDNCESLGTVYKGTKLGNFGLASTFSFYVGHHMSTIEGGAVCTDDDTLATMLRIVRAHGWDRNLDLAKQEDLRKKFRVNSTFYSRYTFYDLGFNFRATEINGFLGNLQLKYLDEIIARRRNNFESIAGKIYKMTDKYYPVRYDHLDLCSNFAVPVVCKTQRIRDDLVAKCADIIEIRPIVAGDITKQPFFHKYVKGGFKVKNAKMVHENGLYFGNNPELTEKEKQQIIKIFTDSK